MSDPLENAPSQILDLSDFVDEARTLKVGAKEFQVYKTSVENAIGLWLKAGELETTQKRANSLGKKLDKELDQKKREEIEVEIFELSKRVKEIMVEQIYEVLSVDNPEVTKKEISSWGFNRHIRIVNWFSEPFLAQGKTAEAKADSQ